MFSQIFAVIELILKLFRLWDGFLDFLVEKKSAELEAKRQKRDAAVDKSVDAKTDDEIWESQDEITRNSP